MRVFFVGCVAFSYASLETLIIKFHLSRKVEIVGVATKEHSMFNADFCNLAPLCDQYQIPFIYTDDINSHATTSFIHSCNPDVIYCFGWSSLIKKQLLDSYPIIGYHPAALPHNRGRHPIIWALALGLQQSASTFFLMEEGADSGNIISQVPFEITFEDNAQSICQKVEVIAQKQIFDFTTDIITATQHDTKSNSQNPSKSPKWGGGRQTYMPKPFLQCLHHKITPSPIFGGKEECMMA